MSASDEIRDATTGLDAALAAPASQSTAREGNRDGPSAAAVCHCRCAVCSGVCGLQLHVHAQPVLIYLTITITKQESLANAKVNARQHCVSLSCLCNSLTQIEWVVQLLLPPKHAKSREIPREFDLTAVQGHPRSSILVSIESPYVTSY